MALLKRLWGDHEPTASPKQTPIPAPSQTPHDNDHDCTLVGTISKALFSVAIRDIKTEGCIHKSVASCQLNIPLCCACADKRPYAATYSRYVDGIGDTTGGTRWQNYCPSCICMPLTRLTPHQEADDPQQTGHGSMGQAPKAYRISSQKKLS